MKVTRSAVLVTAVVASMVSGLSKQIEAPIEVAAFERAGLPVEILSLYGAVEFVLALALVFQRTRKPAALALAALFAVSARTLFPVGLGPFLLFNAAMVPLIFVAGFWRAGPAPLPGPYGGALPIGASASRR